MRKLRLELDSLEVETFDTRDSPARAAGTVHAHGSEDPPPDTAWNQHTCDVMSCGGTCWLTPNVCGTCGTDDSAFDPCG